MLQGEGAHPPADACDFARFCSGLDFWSINDHAEAISPQHWQETKESIRQCNAVAGDPKNPDVVAFLGWEWTQVGTTPDDHYGHKNVIFRDTGEDQVPTRPDQRPEPAARRRAAPASAALAAPADSAARLRRTASATSTSGKYQQELRDVVAVPGGRRHAQAAAPTATSRRKRRSELFEKLSQWGFDTIVIPHGTTWGFYTPPGTTCDKQLTAAQDDPEKQTLIEIYSGHGNSEEYRDWKAIDWDANGNPICPEPTKDYVPCCWQAGELIRARCGDIPSDECERRVADGAR